MQRKPLWLAGPIAFFAMLAALVATWAALEPATLVRLFDNNGRSAFELATLPFFAAIVPIVWWKCPFAGSRARRTILCFAVSLVAILAIAKELDLHLDVLHLLYPDYVGESGGMMPGLFKPDGRPLCGTPYKMRVITNPGVPLGMKAIIILYFASFFGVFAAGMAYLLPTWVRGVIRLSPAAWAWGACGASGVLVQISDRLPAWLDHAYGLDKHAAGGMTSAQSLCTCLEEGGEMMLAALAIVTIILGHRELVRGEE